jgi:ZIP family zinc transporter
MDKTYFVIIILGFLSGITTFIGVALALVFKKSKKGIVFGLSFAAGIMLLISFLELAPEASKLIGISKTLIVLLVGALFFAFLNLTIPHTHMIKEKGRLDYRMFKMAYLVAFGLILHDFPEGFAMANSYMISSGLGIFVAISIAVHNIPEEFAIAVPLVMAKKKKTLIKLATLSALAEPVGAIVGLLSLTIAPALIPYFVSFAAGAMIFVSLHELLPMAHKYKQANYFTMGIVFSIVIYWVLGQFLIKI